MEATAEKYLKKLITEILSEPRVFYHGTRSELPFQNFLSSMDGSGIVNPGRKKSGGFFFTSNLEAAEYFTEWFICKVSISDINPSPLEHKNPVEMMARSKTDGQTYFLNDYLDGGRWSDTIVTVPLNKLSTVKILEWIFVGGDEEFYFKHLDEMFGMGEDDTLVNQDYIQSYCAMTETNLDFLLTIDIFKKYYDSKE